MKTLYLKVLLISASIALVLPLGAVFGHASIYRNKIYPGVKIAQVDVGGLTRDQAAARVRKMIVPPDKFLLNYRAEKWDINFSDFQAELLADKSAAAAFAAGRDQGFFANVRDRYSAWSGHESVVPISWSFSTAKAESVIKTAASTIDRPAVDAKLLVDQKTVNIEPHQAGRETNVKKTLKRIKQALLGNRNHAQVAVSEWEPEQTTADIEALKIEEQLSDYSTSLPAGQSNRRGNIELATRKLNDQYIKPGDVFSFNEIVGPRTAANGFLMAPVILEGNLVPGIGGGICQVATTIYNAAMNVGLPIVERSVHANFISHYPAGRDATVVDGQLDLKFKNDTGGTLLIKGVVAPDAVIFRIYGPKTGRVTVFGEPVVTNYTGYETKIETDTALPPGARIMEQSGVTGRTVQVSRKVSKDNKVLIDEVTTSRYRPRVERIRVGPAPSAETTGTVSP
jgi:vancomycin resistance protein YoaR